MDSRVILSDYPSAPFATPDNMAMLDISGPTIVRSLDHTLLDSTSTDQFNLRFTNPTESNLNQQSQQSSQYQQNQPDYQKTNIYPFLLLPYPNKLIQALDKLGSFEFQIDDGGEAITIQYIESLIKECRYFLKNDDEKTLIFNAIEMNTNISPVFKSKLISILRNYRIYHPEHTQILLALLKNIHYDTESKIKSIKTLINKGADPNCSINNCATLHHMFAYKNKFASEAIFVNHIKDLINLGCDPEKINSDGNSFWSLCEQKNIRINSETADKKCEKCQSCQTCYSCQEEKNQRKIELEKKIDSIIGARVSNIYSQLGNIERELHKHEHNTTAGIVISVFAISCVVLFGAMYRS